MNEHAFKINVDMFVPTSPEQENDISGTYLNNKRSSFSKKELQIIQKVQEHRDKLSEFLMQKYQPEYAVKSEQLVLAS